ncbi:MAG: hypothetical protein ABFD18_03510 [Syntrophomonas sp.]
MSTIELVAICTNNNNIKARRLDTGEKVVWRGRNYPSLVVEGEIFEVEPEKEWFFNKAHFISGKIVSNRIDIAALELEPLAVNCFDRRKREYEMEQVIPGAMEDEMEDPITDAVDLKNMGQIDEAWKVLNNVVEQDIRCIDAHVHMGNFTFGDGQAEYWVKSALKHYTVGVELGNYFLGPGFAGKLPWGLIDNRPYLRALHGQCLCYWALNDFEAAADIARLLLKLNKSDNQGVRFILPDIEKRVPYQQYQDFN